jgi:hypothetical protein
VCVCVCVLYVSSQLCDDRYQQLRAGARGDELLALPSTDAKPHPLSPLPPENDSDARPPQMPRYYIISG